MKFLKKCTGERKQQSLNPYVIVAQGSGPRPQKSNNLQSNPIALVVYGKPEVQETCFWTISNLRHPYDNPLAAGNN